MQSTFTGIEIGKRSLIAHTQGLTTTGHNISNASVEGYSRQRVIMKASDPLYLPGLNREETAGQIGQGVDVSRIERVHDEILEGKIVSQANGEGYWKTRDRYLLMVENTYREPTDYSVRSLMDKYWESWQDLSIHPEETAARMAVVERSEALIDGIHQQYRDLKDIRNMLQLDIEVTVDRVNSILTEVSQLNEQIVKVKAMGDSPNDISDRRDLLVKELSGIINITIDNRDPDEYTIHTSGLHLIQGKVINHLSLEANPLNEGYYDVRWESNGEQAYFEGGSLSALLELRDDDVKGEIQKLDNMTMNFVDLVNENHRAGYGLNGRTGLDFFTEYPFVNNVLGNYDRDGDGEFDSTYVFRVSGDNQLDSEEQVGLQGTIRISAANENIEINYFPTDTVGDIIKRINNSGSEVVARLNREGKLTLKGSPAENQQNPDFVIRNIEDSGQFLVGYAGILNESGADGAYNWEQADAVLALRGGLDYAVAPLSHPSGWIKVNEVISNDVSSIASGFGENGKIANPGDSSTALSIASLRNSDIMVGRVPSFDEYFSLAVAEIGLKGETANRAFETESLIMKELQSMKDSLSGVNIDEELAQMIKFQHGYNAASRFVSEINKMLDVIINRMGV